MMFAKALRDRVRRGEIKCSVRIWQRPHVRVGGRYPMEDGHIEVDQILPITLEDITPKLARVSGFKDVADLLSIAKHGPGESVFLVGFHYIPAKPARGISPEKASGSRPRSRAARASR
jgi:hypothetical protein